MSDMIEWMEENQMPYKAKFHYRTRRKKPRYTKHKKYPFVRMAQNPDIELDKNRSLVKAELMLSEPDAILFWLKFYEKTNLFTMICDDDIEKSIADAQEDTKKPKKIIVIVPTA